MVQPWCHGGVACWWGWIFSLFLYFMDDFLVLDLPHGGLFSNVGTWPSGVDLEWGFHALQEEDLEEESVSCTVFKCKINVQDKNLQWIKMIKFYKYNNCFIHNWNILRNLRTRTVKFFELRLTSPCLSPLHLPIPRCKSVTFVFFSFSKTQSRLCLSAIARWWFVFFFTPIWGRFPIWLIFFNWVETAT